MGSTRTGEPITLGDTIQSPPQVADGERILISRREYALIESFHGRLHNGQDGLVVLMRTPGKPTKVELRGAWRRHLEPNEARRWANTLRRRGEFALTIYRDGSYFTVTDHRGEPVSVGDRRLRRN